MRNRKTAQRLLCLLLLLGFAVAIFTGCFAVSSLEGMPEESAEPESSEPESPEPEDSETEPEVSEPEVSAGWSETREELVRKLVYLSMVTWDESTADPRSLDRLYDAYGEVGTYTLCRIQFMCGEDEAVVEDIFDGYKIFSPSIGRPSANHLYLVGDDTVYTLRTAYRQGLIEGMGALYDLLPEKLQEGYDPAWGTSFDSIGDEEDMYGFRDGVLHAEDVPDIELPVVETGWSETREALVLSVWNELEPEAGNAEFLEICGEVGTYTLCKLGHWGDTAIVQNVYDGYRIFSATIGYPSETHLYLVSDTEIYTLNAAYEQGLIDDMGALYALLPEGMQAGYDPTAEDSYGSWESGVNRYGFTNGVYRAE